MAHDVQITNLLANTQVDAALALANSGYIRYYGGSKPVSGDTALGSQTLLAELRFGSPAFGSASSGIATANPITADSSAPASGTATWFRVVKADGVTKLWDGTIGTSGCDINITGSAVIAAGQSVALTSFTFTHPKA